MAEQQANLPGHVHGSAPALCANRHDRKASPSGSMAHRVNAERRLLIA